MSIPTKKLLIEIHELPGGEKMATVTPNQEMSYWDIAKSIYMALEGIRQKIWLDNSMGSLVEKLGESFSSVKSSFRGEA